jgi:hypothetical protein
LDVPAVTPVTIPEAAPIVAMLVLPLSHVPPAEASVSVVVRPIHTVAVPPMDAGNGLTVTIVVVVQPLVNVKVMAAVPAVSPETTPVDAPTVATRTFPLVHVPGNELLNVVVEPTHTEAIPVGDGVAFTVTGVVA